MRTCLFLQRSLSLSLKVTQQRLWRCLVLFDTSFTSLMKCNDVNEQGFSLQYLLTNCRNDVETNENSYFTCCSTLYNVRRGSFHCSVHRSRAKRARERKIRASVRVSLYVYKFSSSPFSFWWWIERCFEIDDSHFGDDVCARASVKREHLVDAVAFVQLFVFFLIIHSWEEEEDSLLPLIYFHRCSSTTWFRTKNRHFFVQWIPSVNSSIIHTLFLLRMEKKSFSPRLFAIVHRILLHRYHQRRRRSPVLPILVLRRRLFVRMMTRHHSVILFTSP